MSVGSFQWPALAWDVALATIPNSPIRDIQELCQSYDMTLDELKRILAVPHFQYLLDSSLQELQKQGSKAGLRYRAMVLAQAAFEQLYRKMNEGRMKDADALKLLDSLIKAAGLDKDTGAATQVNVQTNIALPFPQGVKKVAHCIEAVGE